ncbi:Hypothetical predicted protein [Paramuricea clavata]|uniref:Uncharacterized protein n=1 Tax=Paramuricea clavata TaxID=317549 RepID=A0A6S7GE91_PARCT|nr:Hypothetical predicted protein [Paramuricea clavata]
MNPNRLSTAPLLDMDIPSGLPPALTPTRCEPPPPPAATKTYTWREWGEWLVKDVPKDIKRKVTGAYRIFKNKVLSLYGKQSTVKSTLVSSAIKNKTAKWMIPGDGFKDPWVFLNNARPEVEKIVNDVKGAKKVYLVLTCELVKEDSKTKQKTYTTFHGRKPMDHVEDDPTKSYRVQYQKHKPSGFSYTIKCMDESVYKTKFVTYTTQNKDDDIGKMFVDSLEENLKLVYEILKKVTPISMTEKDEKNYNESDNCYACNIQFGTVRINEWNESQMEHSGIELLKRKGVFPYEFMTDYDKLQYDRLPSKKEFYSKLNNTDISDEDYEHGQKVWKTFDCKTMRDYHDLYLKTDVQLLTDIMCKFRKTCMENYGLDPLHYYTAPGLAWDAALKITGIELELIHDPTMYLMIEKGIRGLKKIVSKVVMTSSLNSLENDYVIDDVIIKFFGKEMR